MSMTLATYLKQLKATYSIIREDLIDRLIMDLKEWSKTEFILALPLNISKSDQQKVDFAIKRLAAGEPLQYIVGFEWFYGRKFEVNPSVLIPRPETELLVAETIKRLKVTDQKRCLEVGVGSGAVLASIALAVPQATIIGCDISEDAIQVAKRNVERYSIHAEIFKSDVLRNIDGIFDVIISNPPYIAEHEKTIMDDSVLQYEPHVALFAEENGLAIYKQLARQAQQHLAKNGCIIVEIGFRQGEAVSRIFKDAFPEKKISIVKDYSNLDRIVIVSDEFIE